MPLAGDGDGFADCAAGAAGLADHEAYDQQEAKREMLIVQSLNTDLHF